MDFFSIKNFFFGRVFSAKSIFSIPILTLIKNKLSFSCPTNNSLNISILFLINLFLINISDAIRPI